MGYEIEICEVEILPINYSNLQQGYSMIYLRAVVFCIAGKITTNYLLSQWFAPSFDPSPDPLSRQLADRLQFGFQIPESPNKEGELLKFTPKNPFPSVAIPILLSLSSETLLKQSPSMQQLRTLSDCWRSLSDRRRERNKDGSMLRCHFCVYKLDFLRKPYLGHYLLCYVSMLAQKFCGYQNSRVLEYCLFTG